MFTVLRTLSISKQLYIPTYEQRKEEGVQITSKPKCWGFLNENLEKYKSQSLKNKHRFH